MTTTGFGYRDRPLNFGHRGEPRAAPENTLASFQKAREDGADGVELDVQLCADGELVVIHDSSVDRTTNGCGCVRELTLVELKALDAGSWFGPRFRDERVPTLREVVEWAGNDVLLDVELKDFSLEDNGLEQKVIALVRECGMGHRVLLSSFNPLRIWRAKRLAPGVHTGLIYEQGLPIFLRRAWLRLLARPDALHPEYKMVTEAYLVWARRKGYRVNVWAPDHTSEMRRLIAQKVDMIITNRPDVLATVVREQELR
ncbi:MAG TPA: glycerophosphodiester phosphodiesterase family protein [Anaerolineae bacterium]|nr:glycerophosphodiester phosphodiesterase family protein [Anaerolineae bacterium]